MLLDVEAAINKSGNKEAAENFKSFNEELAKPEFQEVPAEDALARDIGGAPDPERTAGRHRQDLGAVCVTTE